MQTPNIAERIKVAQLQPKIKNCYDNQIRDALIEIYTLIGIKEGNLPANKATIYDYIKNDIGEFTITEFPLAFRLYAKSVLDYQPGQYNSVQTFSTIFIENVMQSYSRYRIKYLKSNVNEYQEKQYTKAEIEKIMHDGALNCFRRYKEKGILLDSGNSTYNYLKRIGVDAPDYRQFIEKAKRSERAGFVDSKRKDWFTGQSFTHHLNELELLNQDENKQVITEAKKIALEYYFNELINSGKELNI